VNEFRKVHGDKFIYPVERWGDVSSKSKVTIICREHGEFTQNVGNHIRGFSGCKICKSKNISKGKTTDEHLIKWLEKCSEKHENKYSYPHHEWSKFGSNINVKIICPEHGEFTQRLGAHVTGKGCPKCAVEIRKLKRRLSHFEWVMKCKETHGDEYVYPTYEWGEFNSKDKVKIICRVHGEFFQSMSNHCHKSKPTGCPHCRNVDQRIMYLVDIGGVCFKYGITQDLNRRLNKIRSSSGFEITLIHSYIFSSSSECITCENEVKSSVTPFMSKSDMNEGFTETCSYSEFSNVVEIIRRYKCERT
jgi:hypothetical protein